MARIRFGSIAAAVAGVALLLSTATAQSGGPPEQPGGPPPPPAPPGNPPGAPGDTPELPYIAPYTTRVLVGMTRQFRAVGVEATAVLTWEIVASESAAVDGGPVAEIDESGLFTAQAGGWAIIGLKDAEGDLVAQTDTIWTLGGPTRIDPRRGGRAFSADEFPAHVQFPPQAHARAMRVMLQRRGQQELPEPARGRGRPVALFEFTATDAETGADVGGGPGFAVAAELTLPYDEAALPPGVDEEDLVVGYLDEVEMEWQPVPPEDVVAADPAANTITVRTEHASYWAVLDGASLADNTPTPVQNASWGRIKQCTD